VGETAWVGGKRGGVAVGCTYDYRGVPVGDEGVVVAFCIAERGVAGLGDGALEIVWGCSGSANVRQLRFASVGCLRQAGWYVSGERLNKDGWGLTGVIMSILLEKTRLFFVGDAGVDNDGSVFAVLVICFRGLFGLEMVAGLCGEQTRIGPITFCPRRTCGGKGEQAFCFFHTPLHQPLYFII